MSNQVAAGVGDLVVMLSHSPVHKLYSLADIECVVLSPW